MKAKIPSFAAVAMLLVAISCNDNLIENPSLKEQSISEITAYLDNSYLTKTGIVDNGSGGKDVVWKSGNAISLFFNTGDNGGSKFTTSTNGPVASFTGNIAAVSGSLSEVGGTAYFWATYPYNNITSCDGSGITTILKDKQLAYANDVEDNLLVTVGRSVNPAIYFRNTYTLIEFTLTQENITKIIFSGNNNEKVAGEFTATMSTQNIVTSTPTGNSVKSIEITPAESATFATGTKYYFAFLPGTFSSGYSIKFIRSDGFEAKYKRTTAFTFAIGKYYTMYNKDSGLAFSDNIDFKDPLVKELCVAKWDTNGDGELSFNEANSVTTIDENVFQATSITSFDELQYFTNLGYLEARAFMCCDYLESIVLPENVCQINSLAFANCGNLSSLTSLSPTVIPLLEDNNVFEGTTCIIYVPYDAVDLYKDAWTSFASWIFPIPSDAIGRVKYGNDENWDTTYNSNGNISVGGYGNDEKWDSSYGSGGNLGMNGYGNDTNWN